MGLSIVQVVLLQDLPHVHRSTSTPSTPSTPSTLQTFFPSRDLLEELTTLQAFHDQHDPALGAENVLSAWAAGARPPNQEEMEKNGLR